MKKTIKNLLLFASAICFCAFAQAQDITVSGVVTDYAGTPVPGANVVQKNTTNGVATNFDGNYTIEMPSDAILVFSYIGYTTQEIAVNGQTTLNVTLSEDAAQLDEVVVVGYGQIKKSDLTGSVTSIKAEDVQATPAVNIENAIQGRAAGVLVTSTNGAPGAGATIRIRGGNSITAGNEPLYVIDGFIGGGDLNSINVQDIESIEVLKDASSTAIYGARGANGVILITTKRGKEGGGLTVDAYTGFQQLPETIDLLNGQLFAELYNEVIPDTYANPASIGEGTDWQRVGVSSATMQNVTLSFNGGTDNTKTFLSANFFDQDGIVKKTGIKRYQVRANIDHKVSETFKVGTTLNVNYNKREFNKTSLGSLVALNPAEPVFLPDGSYNFVDSASGLRFDNPQANLDLVTNRGVSKRILASMFGELTLVKGLTFKPSVSFDVSDFRNLQFYPSALPIRNADNRGGRAIVEQGQGKSVITEGLFNYYRDFGESNLNVVLGATFQKTNNSDTYISAENLPTDNVLFDALELAEQDQVTVRSNASERQILSYLGRINYSINGKYLFTLTGRRDGSSVFGANNKWANFGAAAIGWNLGRESFIEDLGVFDKLKLRASFGQSGNQGISPYQTLGSLGNSNSIFDGQKFVGLTQSRLPNPDLKWETTDQLDLGLEMGFFNNRLQLELGYYEKTTDDLLFQVDLPFQVGFTSQLRNVGKVENRGFELFAQANIVNTDDFGFDLSLNVSTNKNEVVNLADDLDFLTVYQYGPPDSNVASALIPGEPIGAFIGLDYLGVWKDQEEIDNSDLSDSEKSSLVPGDQKYADHNGDGEINTEDQHVIGDPTPDFFGGINTAFRYKNFDLSLFFQGSYGNDLYDLNHYNKFSSDIRLNQYSLVLDRWTPTNTDTDIPRANADTQRFSNTSDLSDGSYLRLKTVRVGYNVPVDNIKAIQGMNIYLTGNNLFLIKSDDFRGYDPEVNQARSGQSTLERGFYSANYPQNRSIILGVKVDL